MDYEKLKLIFLLFWSIIEEIGVESNQAKMEVMKVKRVLSDEQKAKMKAGREAAAARKAEEKAAAVASGVPLVETPKKTKKSDSEEVAPDAPKKAKKASSSSETEGGDGELKPKRILTEEQKAKMKV